MRRLLMANRLTSGHRESEPVVVDTDDPNLVVVELDDGGRLELDPRELRSAIEEDRLPPVSNDRRFGFESSRLGRLRGLG